MWKGRCLWIGLLAVVILLAGCGDVPALEAPNAPRGVAREYVPIDLPWAQVASAPRLDAASMYTGEWERGERQVLNVIPPAEVIYKNIMVDLAEGAEPALPADALAVELAAAHEMYGDERDAFVLLLNADKEVSWSVARTVLEVGLGSPFGFHELHVACRSPGLAGDVRVEFPVEHVDAPPDGIRLHLLRTSSGAYRLDRRRGEVIEATCELPWADATPDGVWLPILRADFQAVVRAEGPTYVTVDDAVPLQGVVTLLDLLRDAGAQAVVLLDIGVELWLRAQDTGEPWNPEPDRPVGPVGGGAIALLCLVAGWLAWRSRRPI